MRTTPWQLLEKELSLWAASGQKAQFWWRDDDATEPTKALDRLLQLGLDTVSPAFAVIPAKANSELIFMLGSLPDATVMPHGYAHVNHAPPGQKKTELGFRPVDDMIAELQRGYDFLSLLTDQEGLVTLLPIIVPPWNRIAPELSGVLAAAGFGGMSTYGPREAARDLVQVNCHADPIDWHGTRGFAGEEACLRSICRHLGAKRQGTVDPDEPTGFLTHHLIFDEQSWGFTAHLLGFLKDHPAATLLTPRQVFPSLETGTIIWP